MKSTILSRELLQETLDHFDEFREHMPERIVQKSMPILFFGDLKSYMVNDFKIITAALNPSDLEFKNAL